MRRHAKTVVVVMGVLLAGTAVLAGVSMDRKAEKCKLRKAGLLDDEKHVKFELGKTLELKGGIYITDFMGRLYINAPAIIKNPTKRALHYSYHVAFFDKKGKLIGCDSISSFGDEGIKAGDTDNCTTMHVEIPHAALKQAVSYQVVFYESNKQIGEE